jgi:hypothetical protein
MGSAGTSMEGKKYNSWSHDAVQVLVSPVPPCAAIA